MKKILFMSLLAGAFVLTACDPAQEKVDNNTVTASENDLLSGITFTQFSDEAFTTPAADGNYIKYTTNPGRQVQIIAYRGDGSLNLMASGASGSFSIKPGRGSDPNQVFYVRHLNSDGSVTTAQTSLTVFVQQELDPEIKYFASNAYGSKTWKWNVGNKTSSGHVWGNFGSDASWRGEALNDFVWWGVDDAADLIEQLGHSVTGQATGEEDNDASMVFTEDGLVKCYDASGKEIRSGSYEVKEWTGELNGFRYGILHTTEGATLFPFEINAKDNGGQRYVTDYWIYALSTDEMILVYPDNGAFSGWSEGTYWNFKSTTDIDGMFNGYGSKTWTWNVGCESTGGRVWGNFGSDASWRGSNLSDFVWWGVEDAEGLLDQLGHSVTGEATGEESNDATMVLSDDGLVKCYDANGTEIRSGTYEIDLSTANSWQLGTFKTSSGATLFPFEINAKDHGGQRYVTDYQIWSISDSEMILTYPDNGAFSGWSEGTYWAFKKK